MLIFTNDWSRNCPVGLLHAAQLGLERPEVPANPFREPPGAWAKLFKAVIFKRLKTEWDQCEDGLKNDMPGSRNLMYLFIDTM